MAIHKDDAVDMTATPTVETPATKPSLGLFGRIKRYLREVLAELKKTNWPTRDELTKSTIVIMLTILVVAVFLFVADNVVAQIMVWVGIVPPAAGG